MILELGKIQEDFSWPLYNLASPFRSMYADGQENEWKGWQ